MLLCKCFERNRKASSIDDHRDVKSRFSITDECGQSGGEADSDEDVITDYHLIPTLQAEMLPRPGGPGGPLPTISVTPHSPANKTYPVLEDTLQQVRELHESVQQMRNVTTQSEFCFVLFCF